MTAIQQTVEIGPSRQLTIDVPPEVPTGRVILTFTPQAAEETPPSGGWKKTLDTLKRTHGAWAARPWLTALEDIRASRDACAERDPWNEYLEPGLPAADKGGNG